MPTRYKIYNSIFQVGRAFGKKKKEKIAADALEVFPLSSGDEKQQVREGAASGKLTISVKRTQRSEILLSAVLQRLGFIDLKNKNTFLERISSVNDPEKKGLI
ncbi:uncharacterized protein DS421_17g580480 [Arachis hypogaea]|nr:uncharacterized protein DS421_17g580480 [Arachis hypogaea]